MNSTRNAISVRRLLSLFSVLCALWLLLSGFFTPFLLAAGAGSALLVTLIASRMGLLQARDAGLRWSLAPLGYLMWLLIEIVKSSWQVTRIILTPSLPISPTMIRFAPKQKTSIGLVIHAHSITLTPGTYTVEASADTFLVHGLTSAGAGADVESETDLRVRALESDV